MNGTLDFHGLHVAEAKECLIELLPLLKSMNTLSHVTIVTGTGHHSNGPQAKARLLPRCGRLV